MELLVRTVVGADVGSSVTDRGDWVREQNAEDYCICQAGRDGEVEERVIGWPLRVGGRLADSVMCEHEHRTVSTEKNKLVLLNTPTQLCLAQHY